MLWRWPWACVLRQFASLWAMVTMGIAPIKVLHHYDLGSNVHHLEMSTASKLKANMCCAGWGLTVRGQCGVVPEYAGSYPNIAPKLDRRTVWLHVSLSWRDPRFIFWVGVKCSVLIRKYGLVWIDDHASVGRRREETFLISSPVLPGWK